MSYYGSLRQTAPDCKPKRCTKRMFHKEGISSSNSSLMKSAVFIKSNPHDNLQVTPQRKHFEQKDKASIILRSFNHQEKEVKKSSKIMFPEKNNTSSLTCSPMAVKSSIKIVPQREHSYSQSSSIVDMINKATPTKPRKQTNKNKLNDSWRVFGLNCSGIDCNSSNINNNNNNNSNFESRNNSRAVTPKPHCNPITGEGYREQLKQGKKVLKKDSIESKCSNRSTKENLVPVLKQKPTEAEIIKEFGRLNKLQKIQKLQPSRGAFGSTTQPRMKF